jgi:hypothetical protein
MCANVDIRTFRGRRLGKEDGVEISGYGFHLLIMLCGFAPTRSDRPSVGALVHRPHQHTIHEVSLCRMHLWFIVKNSLPTLEWLLV